MLMKYGSISRRKRTQPLGERSAGSVFRNPSELGVAAAELIEKAGLKSFREDGAMISNIQANFFINAGGSTSQDMLDHIALAKEKVDQKFGVQLREEIIHVQPYSDGLITNRSKYQPCNL
jgi:UDP-N-acetylenolpyruvoylglucosamine reductase